MTSRASMLASLRRSVLGAWLAAAYALAVLAVALAPVPGGHAIGAELGAVLCSGAPLTDGSGQGAPAAPLGEFAHCKGCAHNPVLAGPPVVAAVVGVRMASIAKAEAVSGASLPQGVVQGLPPSRAPPAA